MFIQMESNKVISTRGLKDDANLYGELIFDVNSAYFHNHGGYKFAKQFYEDAYKTLSNRIEDLASENRVLRNVAENYERVSHAYGPERVAATVERSRGRSRPKRSKNV
jgi:hypothetical protein